MKSGAKLDMEERTYDFALKVRLFVKSLKNTISNVEDSRQLIRSSGSVGANFIEAREGVSDKDFVYRAKISKKEAKESIYWLKLIKETNQFNDSHEIKELINEADEIKRILSTMIYKMENKLKQVSKTN